MRSTVASRKVPFHPVIPLAGGDGPINFEVVIAPITPPFCAEFKDSLYGLVPLAGGRFLRQERRSDPPSSAPFLARRDSNDDKAGY